MPRKLKMSAKLKKEILKKLMKMSIEVDGYIYNNKVISVAMAQNNLEEINALKALDCHDARTLQVIEKLTRHMKNIIGEAKPQNSTKICLRKPSVNAVTTPPCSKIDPNFTQVNSASNYGSTSPSILTNNNEEINDETLDSPVKEINNNPIPSIKPISSIIQQIVEKNLNSMTQETKTHKDKINNDCMSQDIFGESQSILENCDKITSQRTQSNEVTITIPSTETLLESAQLKKPQNQQVNSSPTVRRLRNKTRKNEDKTYNKKITKTRKRRTSYTETNTTTQSYGRQVSYYQQENNTECDKNSTKNSTDVTLHLNNNNTVNNACNYTTPTQPKLVNVPDNKIIETDLSWVENLKYVRQIVPENFDPKLSNLAESFWENCSFSGLIEHDDFHVY